MKSQSNGWKSKLDGFMQGRNGMDSISITCAVCAMILLLINIFLDNNIVLTVIGDVLLIYSIIRMMSRNVSQRQAEAAKFDNAIKKPRQSATLALKKFNNRKTTCYFTCSHCKKVYAVPKGKGKIRATCPHCHEQEIRTT